MTETLAVIDAPHFNCGIVFRDDLVARAAPIVSYMHKGGWTLDQVRSYCAKKGWRISVVHELERQR